LESLNNGDNQKNVTLIKAKYISKYVDFIK